jgi:hypothetical protein
MQFVNQIRGLGRGPAIRIPWNVASRAHPVSDFGGTGGNLDSKMGSVFNASTSLV